MSSSFDALFDALTDQERVRRILAGMLTAGTVPNALLFTGIDGIGKQTAALWFAMAANCFFRPPRAEAENTGRGIKAPDRTAPCGDCRTCAKIKTGSHPDVMIIIPEKDVIKISRVRELIEKIAFKPHQANLRVIVIADARAMNREASNALLKVLEEPPPQTIFILTAGHAADLLPTVVSRCQQIRFHPVSLEAMKRYLVDHRGVVEEIAEMAAVMADGSFFKALSLVDDSRTAQAITRRRGWLLDELERLPSRPLPQVLAFADKLARDKTQLPASLDIIGSYLRDMLIGEYCPERIINRDRADRIAGPVDRIKAADRKKNRTQLLIDKLDALAETEAALARNANQRLSLDVLALKLADILI